MTLSCDTFWEIIPYEIQVRQFSRPINLVCIVEYIFFNFGRKIHRHLIWDAFTVSRIRRVCRLWRGIVDDLYRRRNVPVPHAKV